MSEHPSPMDDDWSAWATLSNDVSAALGALRERPLFSRRRAVAEAIWKMGYRPSVARIKAESDRQQAALARAIREGRSDDEEFCPDCFAGMEFPQHHEQCVDPGTGPWPGRLTPATPEARDE